MTSEQFLTQYNELPQAVREKVDSSVLHAIAIQLANGVDLNNITISAMVQFARDMEVSVLDLSPFMKLSVLTGVIASGKLFAPALLDFLKLDVVVGVDASRPVSSDPANW